MIVGPAFELDPSGVGDFGATGRESIAVCVSSLGTALFGGYGILTLARIRQ